MDSIRKYIKESTQFLHAAVLSLTFFKSTSRKTHNYNYMQYYKVCKLILISRHYYKVFIIQPKTKKKQK